MPALARFVTLSLVFASNALWPSSVCAQDNGILLKVSVDTVRETEIGGTFVGTGTVAAWREMPISSEADGLAIVEVRADEGDSVERGQVLARLKAWSMHKSTSTRPLSPKRRLALPMPGRTNAGPAPLLPA